MEFNSTHKYLFLDDIAWFLWKSRSFCQKEVNSWRLVWEKKYILWKRKIVIRKEDFINYIKTYPERVGKIQNFQENIDWISKTLSEMEQSYTFSTPKEKVNYFNAWNSQLNSVENTQVMNERNEERIQKSVDSSHITNGNELNNLYIEQLKITIEDLKKNKDDDKWEYKKKINELEQKINELQDELKDETKKVERSFFISDRYEKTLNKQNELLLNMINFAKNLWEWHRLSLWELKTLISSYGVNEKVVIDSNTSDVKLINQVNEWFYEKLNLIDENIIIEISRDDEIRGKDYNIGQLTYLVKRKNKFINMILTFVVLYWIFEIWLLILKYNS